MAGDLGMTIGVVETSDPGIVELGIAGRLDTTTVREAEHAIMSQYACQRYGLMLDVSALEYISSAGVALLYRAAETARLNQGGVVLFPVVGRSDGLPWVLNLLGMGGTLHCAADREEAFRILSASRR